MKDSSFGLRASPRGAADENSASVPRPKPNTSSPGRNSVTSLPVDSTTPARSAPRIGSAGLRMSFEMIVSRSPPWTVCQSSAFTDAARTLTSTRPSSFAGRSTSRRWSTSAEPLPSCTIAFIVVALTSVAPFIAASAAVAVVTFILPASDLLVYTVSL